MRRGGIHKRLAGVVLAALILLIGCAPHRAEPATTVVPEGELTAFLAQVKTQDYHDVARTGKALLRPGLVIPDHETRLKGFPSSVLEEGIVRYDLMSFEGEQGGYGIHLFLKEESGEIINFLPFEWW